MKHDRTLLDKSPAKADTLLSNATDPVTAILELAPTPFVLDSGQDDVVRWTPGERFNNLFESRVDQLVRDGNVLHVAVASPEGDITYGELEHRANQLARYIIKKGVKPNSSVGLLLDRSWWSYAAMLAVAKAGAAYIPLDPSFPKDRLEFIAQDADVSLILTTSELAPQLSSLSCPILALDRHRSKIEARSGARLKRRRRKKDRDALCYIIYTSGSTGKPKGVAVCHSSICNFIRVAAETYGICASDRVYQGMTIAFDFSVEEIWVPLFSGATLVPRPSSTALLGKDLAEFLEAKQITALCCVPSLLATIEDELPRLRFLLVSGEACPRHLVERWYRPDRILLNVYGPTETTVSATWAVLDPAKPVTIGRPLPTYKILIVDETGRKVLAKGETGEIAIAGPGLAQGYVNRPDLTQRAFLHDILHLADNSSSRIYRTGDLGRINDDNEVEYLGRVDTQVKIRGYRIELTEIESVLMRVPGIAAAVVSTWEPAPDIVELVAYYTSGTEVDQDRIFSEIENHLPSYMLPRYFERLASLPMLASNKVDRKRLPPPKSLRFSPRSSSRCYSPPQTSTETELAQSLSELLGLEQVSVEDHFFDALGANSLTMARFCASLRETPRYSGVSMREVYTHPTIRELGCVLDQSVESSSSESPHTAVRRATTFEFVGTGVLQLLAYCVMTFPFGLLIVEGFAWIHVAEDLTEAYIRALAFGVCLALLQAALPVALKWLLIGRWKQETIPIWSLRYVKFWIVRSLILTSPMILFAGSPIFNVYLRLLGARIGRNVVFFSSHIPICTDLISIGDNSVVRKDSLLPGYRAVRGFIETGAISIGANAFVGEGTVLEIDTAVGDDAQVGHCSSLQKGQRVANCKRVQGSPAQSTDVDFIAVSAGTHSIRRKICYSTYQLSSSCIVALPLTLLALEFMATWLLFDNNDHASGYGDFNIGPPALHMDLLLASGVLYLATIILNIGLAYALPRTLGRLVVEGRVYPLFGMHYILYRVVSVGSNSRHLNHLFGDSSFIVHLLKVVGYRMPGLVQTGSNFGLEQKHDFPHFCQVGSGTIVSDGLSIVNATLSSTSFAVAKASIGARNFLGNNIIFPAGGKTGDNVLLATKVAVPLSGALRSDTGLLGSPCFEIPRTVLRDRRFDFLKSGAEHERRLISKAVANSGGIVMFIAARCFSVYLLLVSIGAFITAFRYLEHWIIPIFALVAPAITAAYFILVERASMSFQRLQPQFCSMYDPYYWRHERYWKLNASLFIAPFSGTPAKGWLWRSLGVRVGKKLFDDGCTIPERSLTEIGDHCTLNRASILQGHSQEDGTFKSDHIRLGNEVTIGCNAFVHYGTIIGTGAYLGADSFLMKGEIIRPHSMWHGNPARQVHG